MRNGLDGISPQHPSCIKFGMQAMLEPELET